MNRLSWAEVKEQLDPKPVTITLSQEEVEVVEIALIKLLESAKNNSRYKQSVITKIENVKDSFIQKTMSEDVVKINGIQVDVRNEKVLYVTIGDWVVYLDDSTDENIISSWKN